MVNKNYHDLKNEFNKLHNHNSIKRIWHEEFPEELDGIIFELTRLLSNFVCMAKAVIDVNRVLLRKNIDDEIFLKEISNEILKRFTNNPLAQFVEGLRNFSLHYESPIGNVKPVTSENENMGVGDKFEVIDSKLVLIKKKLSMWESWKKGKIFLDSQEDNIDIESVIDEYYKLLTEYDCWYLEKLEKYFSRS